MTHIKVKYGRMWCNKYCYRCKHVEFPEDCPESLRRMNERENGVIVFSDNCQYAEYKTGYLLEKVVNRCEYEPPDDSNNGEPMLKMGGYDGDYIEDLWIDGVHVYGDEGE